MRTRTPISFLECLDHYVHVELRKLYPEAQLPRFFCHRPSPEQLLMDYASARHLADLAHGLIEATLENYGRTGTIARHDIVRKSQPSVRFTLTLH